MEAVGDAAELLVDQEPLEHRPALTPELGGDPPTLQAGGDRLALDPPIVASGRRPARSSASTSSGISTVSVNSRARWQANCSVENSVANVVMLMVVLGLSGDGASARAWPDRRLCARAAGRQTEQQVVVVGDHGGGAQARATRRGHRDRTALDQIDDAMQVSEPPALAAAEYQPLDPGSLRAHRPPEMAAGRASVATACGSSRSGSGVTDSQDARLPWH